MVVVVVVVVVVNVVTSSTVTVLQGSTESAEWLGVAATVKIRVIVLVESFHIITLVNNNQKLIKSVQIENIIKMNLFPSGR